MDLVTILLEKNEKNKKFLNMLVNSISIEKIIIQACICAVDIESYRSCVDEIF